MPKYDYRCPACDAVFEIERSMSDTSEVVCPACGSVAKKVFSPAGMVLKGSGFYNTDNRPRSTEKEAAPACDSGASCAGCPAKAASEN